MKRALGAIGICVGISAIYAGVATVGYLVSQEVSQSIVNAYNRKKQESEKKKEAMNNKEYNEVIDITAWQEF